MSLGSKRVGAVVGLQQGEHLADCRVIVDEKGAECLLKDVDYFQYSIWTIKSNCGAFGGMGG